MIISPDELNRHLRTVLIAPMTTKGHPYPTRIECRFQGKRGWVVLDQIRATDRGRLLTKLGKIDRATAGHVLSVLAHLFAP